MPSPARVNIPLAALRRIVALFRLLRRWISRREWTVRLLGLEVSASDPDTPGVILLQVDGLSRTQLERALQRGKMPFVRTLCKSGDHRLASFYSGLPSTTPAVQAELFFGVRAAVPAFAFRDWDTQQTVEMIQPSAAGKMEEACESDHRGLLEGGSAYCNIYSGGATEPHFCASAMGVGQLLGRAGVWSVTLVILWNMMAVVRSLGLLFVEFGVAVVDFFRGILDGNDLWCEFKLVPARVIVGVWIRELITIGVEADAVRGLPIIHANFLGYDEQSHARGPDSAMAHWSLRQIDGAIARIVRAARASRRRNYQVWLYSDHGQQASTPYQDDQGRSLEEVVGDFFEDDAAEPSASAAGPKTTWMRGIQTLRAGWLGGVWARRLAALAESLVDTDGNEGSVRPTVVAKGPLGHIYLPASCDLPRKQRLAAKLAREARVPWVFMPRDTSGVQAWHGESTYQLPEDAETVFGKEHPFLPELVEDFERVCRHRNAGDLVVSGWHPAGSTVSFVREKGAHAGPGTEETSGFVLVPSEVRMPAAARFDYWRPSRLRQAVLRTSGREQEEPELSRPLVHDRCSPASEAGNARRLRIMTYNVHRCIGTDGKLSPARIAWLIASCNPDIVALQEVDVGRAATGRVDQAARIARELTMYHTFHPSIVFGSEAYGNAILSRVPIRLRGAGLLPVLDGRPSWEPRGVLWVTVETENFPLQLFATHLGLSRKERQLQLASLLGPDWLGHPECDGPIVLCGDFNATSNSPIYRQLTARFRDAQTAVAGHRPQCTWFSRYPVLRLDHVFLSHDLTVRYVQVPDTYLARVASDHLPLIADVEFNCPARPNSAATSCNAAEKKGDQDECC
jgi:endonuclease/exonuclease/phosphatase family metal-dependent hydrolase